MTKRKSHVVNTLVCGRHKNVEWCSHTKLHRLWHYRNKSRLSQQTEVEIVQGNRLRFHVWATPHVIDVRVVWLIKQRATDVWQSAISTKTAWLTASPNLLRLYRLPQDNTVVVFEYNSVFYALLRVLRYYVDYNSRCELRKVIANEGSALF